ncbi:hypothetical protein [Cohnella faecalis]|uniref:hypothetical protein n=1 Tax=Cohnella faecalis TaxID=2315694 RepID=UPI002D79C1EB|nr:hypothetical protein [Cohnella faecalis]
MNKQPGSVPFGYEPPADTEKGTLIYYDTFESSSEKEWDRVADYAIERSFRRLVLYLIHEETAKRMSRKTPVSAYYKREARLSQWLEERGDPTVSIDGWEGKRKKVYADRFRAPSFDRDAAGPSLRVHDDGYRQFVRFVLHFRIMDR